MRPRPLVGRLLPSCRNLPRFRIARQRPNAMTADWRPNPARGGELMSAAISRKSRPPQPVAALDVPSHGSATAAQRGQQSLVLRPRDRRSRGAIADPCQAGILPAPSGLPAGRGESRSRSCLLHTSIRGAAAPSSAYREMQPGERPRSDDTREYGSPSRTRTCDHSINSRMLYQLSYRGSAGRPYSRFSRLAKPFFAAVSALSICTSSRVSSGAAGASATAGYSGVQLAKPNRSCPPPANLLTAHPSDVEERPHRQSGFPFAPRPCNLAHPLGPNVADGAFAGRICGRGS